MSGIAWVLYLSAFGAVVVSTVLAFLASGRERLERVGLALVATAVACSTALIVLRWIQSGHPPLFGTFENTLAAAWSLLGFSVVCGRTPDARDVWRFAAPWAFAAMAWGTRYPMDPVPLTISEQSLWVDIHVLFAWFAFVPLLVVGTMALAEVVLPGRRRHSSAEGEQALTQRLLMWGFFGFTGMLATGAWYLNTLFGTLWQWGVVETLSLIAWLVYGVILHGVLWRRWRGPGLRWALALTIPILLLAFFIWSVFPGTFHFFDIPLVRPY